jgi:hypothetical protein
MYLDTNRVNSSKNETGIVFLENGKWKVEFGFLDSRCASLSAEDGGQDAC